MPSTRQLKTKIGAVRNIKQITRAMQMVAATKMRKSQEVALNARPYAKKSFALLLHLLKHANREELESVFWTDTREKWTHLVSGATSVTVAVPFSSEKIALVVITSDKGLAGSFNSSVLREAARWKTEQAIEGKQVEIVAVGKKARDFFKKQGVPIAAEFFQFSDIITFADVKPLADWVVSRYARSGEARQAYKALEYSRIAVCSNQFVSALVQKVGTHDILPLQVEELGRIIEGIVPRTGKYSEIAKQEENPPAGGEKELSFVLEPSREEIMRELVENLIQVEIMYFVFESNASEHSARMVAMKNATENANRLGEELTLQLNKARQAAITQELAEVTTAKEALTAE